MATIVRQPFAPLDGARLQSLTSIKNRQNVLSTNSPTKRKASEVLDGDNSENVDPAIFCKRSKGTSADTFPAKDTLKPSSLVPTNACPAPAARKEHLVPAKRATLAAAPRPRVFLQPKSPIARLTTSVPKPSPLSAPAGRSPTRGSRRIGLLSSHRRTGEAFARVDPPSFGPGPAAPFSLDAALKGTIPSYIGRAPAPSRPSGLSSLVEPESKSSWFFEIHEDTPEQEMTNLLQHGTCTLDISSDEESENKVRSARADGRNKENIPPENDVSQTTSATRRAAGSQEDEMAVEKPRGPLVEMDPVDYYPQGCDSASVIVIAEDEQASGASQPQSLAEPRTEESPKTGLQISAPSICAPETRLGSRVSVQALMSQDKPASKAAVLEPLEGTDESFELWESSSAKDETERTPRDISPGL